MTATTEAEAANGAAPAAIDRADLQRLAEAAARLLAAAVRSRAASAKTTPDPTVKT